MRVGIDGELHARVPGSGDVLRRQVHPVRRGVDLQGGPGTGARRVESVQVDLDRRAAADLAGRDENKQLRAIAAKRLSRLTEVTTHLETEDESISVIAEIRRRRRFCRLVAGARVG
jgi:uncharacterized protein YqfA (UPF0365 family)